MMTMTYRQKLKDIATVVARGLSRTEQITPMITMLIAGGRRCQYSASDRPKRTSDAPLMAIDGLETILARVFGLQGAT